VYISGQKSGREGRGDKLWDRLFGTTLGGVKWMG